MVDEGAQPPLRPGVEDTQRGVLRVDQGAGDRHDPREDPVEGEVGGHRDDGVEQQAQPGLLVEHALHPVQHLAQEVVELHVAEGSPRVELGAVVAAAVRRSLLDQSDSSRGRLKLT